MTVFVQTTNIVANNSAAFSLPGSFDSLLVVAGVTVASVGSLSGPGVWMQGGLQRVTVAGTVAGATGVLMAGNSGHVEVVAGGLVTGLTAVQIEAVIDSAVVNAGTIAGQVNGIVATGGLTLTNTGTISGSQATLQLSGAADTILNAGTILGQCLLSGGADLFDTSGGRVIGIVDLGSGDDTFVGGAAADRMGDGIGADLVELGRGDDVVFVNVDTSSDSLDGGDGFDALDLGGFVGGLRINLDRGTVHDGGPGLDLISGFEAVLGGQGDDTVTGGDLGANLIRGRAGADQAFGGGGDDRIFGGDGRNLVDGGDGNDRLVGGDGGDTIRGGAGNDLIHAAYDVDRMTGDAGADRFVWRDIDELFEIAVPGFDRITDFLTGTDLIDLSAIDAGFGGGDEAFVFVGTGPLTAPGQVAIRQTAAATFVDISLFVAGAAGSIRLDGLLTLAAADFVL